MRKSTTKQITVPAGTIVLTPEGLVTLEADVTSSAMRRPDGSWLFSLGNTFAECAGGLAIPFSA